MSATGNERKRLTGEERKAQILETASRMVAEKGFKSVSTREIAQAAGINEALIFRHFSTKEALLTEVILNIVNRRPGFPTTAAATPEEFVTVLTRFETFFTTMNLENPNALRTILYAVLEGYPLPPEFDFTRSGTFLNWLYQSIEKGKREWGFRNSADSRVVISFFMGGLIYFVLQTAVIKAYPVEEKSEGEMTRGFLEVLRGKP